MKKSINIHGINCILEIEDPIVAQELYADFRYSHSDEIGKNLIIQYAKNYNPKYSLSPGTITFSTEKETHCCLDDGRILLIIQDQKPVFAEMDFSGGVIRVSCVDATIGYPFLRKLILDFVCNISSMRTGLILHAAAVSRDSKGVVILGNSGAGKSTTLTLFLRNGWSYLCDDLAFLTLENDNVFIDKFPTRLALSKDLVSRLKIPGTITKSLSASNSYAGKYFGSATDLFGSTLGQKSVVRCLVFPCLRTVSDKTGVPERVDPSIYKLLCFERHSRLYPMYQPQGYRSISSTAFEISSRLLNQSKCYNVSIAPDLSTVLPDWSEI